MREEDAIKLTDVRPDELEKVITIARDIWRIFYHGTKQSGRLRKRRWDHGRKAGV